MAISLGRETVVTFDGVTVPGVRDVTVDYSVSMLDIQPFGSRHAFAYPTAYAVSLSLVTIDDTAAATATAAAIAGTEIAVAVGGHSFTAIVASVSDGQPMDDVRSWQIQLSKTQAGLR